MGVATEIERALAELATSGRVEVHENGRWLAALSSAHCEVRTQGATTLIHLWSEECNLVRRVLRVAEQSPGRMVLEVQRFGRSKAGTLEFVCAGAERPVNRLAREKFCSRFRELLAEQFPDEQIDSLTTASDLEHSLSGCYARGLLHRGQRAWAVMGVSSSEEAATMDAILTYALVWLDWTREHARGRVVAGLRLFLPEDSARLTIHRLSALDPSTHIELFELQETLWRGRLVDTRDIGNLATWLTPRRELEYALAEAQKDLEKIRALAPEAIGIGVPPGTRDIALRFRGVEFARWHRGTIALAWATTARNSLRRTGRPWSAWCANSKPFAIRLPRTSTTRSIVHRRNAGWSRWFRLTLRASMRDSSRDSCTPRCRPSPRATAA